MLHDNGIAYKEELVSENWAELKPTMPFGQVPCLYDGNLQIVQSGAILRHLARKHGLYGSSELDKTMIDMIDDGQKDLRIKCIRMVYQDYEKGCEPFKKDLPNELKHFEKLLAQNGDGKSFFVGSSPSFVDYTMLDLLEMLTTLDPDCLSECPALKGFMQRMAEPTPIKNYKQTQEVIDRKFTGSGHL
jgi:glutathione S-transferase